MLSKLVLSDEERTVDPQLGYPNGYAKLCRHAHIQLQGLITPFTEGPPQRFHPYAPAPEDLAKLKEFESLFPIVSEEERDPSNARRHAILLWQQLDHIGDAGFDPSLFRVDAYGNVLYWNADTGSPLAWEVDHWFPHSRGGRTVPSNLRIVQWQVNQRKSRKLEFLVPWWDLQIGVSVNQFLSVFASKNADFRQRAFSLFFLAGENERLDDKCVGEGHSWPPQFRERKNQVGLAASALVSVQKDTDDPLKVLNGNKTAKQVYLVNTGTPARRRWTLEEEEALRRGLQKFGPGSWKEIKEFEPLLANRSTVQIKDKYRLMRGDWQLDKENGVDSMDRQTEGLAALLQKEVKLRQVLEIQRKQKEEETMQMEEQLQEYKTQNEKEKSVLEELEQTLAKQRKRVEKQRRWSETQSQYRLCLEKMIRDTMHQCVVYKEQARLNQAACNALLARLESQKLACDAAEAELDKKVEQRESLEALARPKIVKRTRNEGHTDVGSCIKPNAATVRFANYGCKIKSFPETVLLLENGSNQIGLHIKEMGQSYSHTSTEPASGDSIALEANNEAGVDANEDKGAVSVTASTDSGDSNGWETKTDEAAKEDKAATSVTASIGSGFKRKASDVKEEGEVEVVSLRYEYGEQDDNKAEREESVADNVATYSNDSHDLGGEIGKPLPTPLSSCGYEKSKGNQQLGELVQEVLSMRGRVNEAMVDAIEEEEGNEEEKVKRVGKVSLEKWFQRLMVSSGVNGDNSIAAKKQAKVHDEEQAVDRKGHDGRKDGCSGHEQDGKGGGNWHMQNGDSRNSEPEQDGDVKGGIMGSFWRKLGMKQGAGERPMVNMPITGELHVKQGTHEADKSMDNVQQGIEQKADKTAELNVRLGADRTEELDAKQGEEKAGSKAREDVPVLKRVNSGAQGRQSKVDNTAMATAAAKSNAAGNPATGSKVDNTAMATAAAKSNAAGNPATVVAAVKCANSNAAAMAVGRRELQLEERKVMESFSRLRLGEGRREKEVAAQQLVCEAALFAEKMKEGGRRSSSGSNHSGGGGSVVSCSRRQSVGGTPSNPKEETRRHSMAGTALGAVPVLLHSRSHNSGGGASERSISQPRQAAAAAGGGGAARKASMLMKSASTRAAGGGAVGSPARSSSSSGRQRRGGEGETPPAPEAASLLRRKASFFQDWDALPFSSAPANEGLRASLSHAWRKAVKKFDLART